MNYRLQSLFDTLESDRRALLAKIQAIPPEKFNRNPNGGWSIGHILSHLLTAERLSRLYMMKKIKGVDDAGNTGIFEEGKMLLLQVSQRLPFKFKAPQVVVDHTAVFADVHTLEKAWDLERQELKTFLESIKEDQLRKKIFKHVRAGRLNIQHALIFAREHFMHHLPQILRLLKQ